MTIREFIKKYGTDAPEFLIRRVWSEGRPLEKPLTDLEKEVSVMLKDLTKALQGG